MAELNVLDGPSYEPPTVEDIPLHPQEQVLFGCKTSTTQPPSTPTTNQFCGPNCRSNINS
jgi:hypothetical protein